MARLRRTGVAAEYSAVSGGKNQRTALQSVTITTRLLCLTTIKNQGIPCSGNTTVPYNAVQVTQTTVMPTYFAGVLGHPTITMTAVSTAATRGGAPRASNVAVIIDTTPVDVERGYKLRCKRRGADPDAMRLERLPGSDAESFAMRSEQYGLARMRRA